MPTVDPGIAQRFGVEEVGSIFLAVSFVPYLFALYLILFLGLYSVVVQFSFSQLIQSLLFVVAGHYIARKIRRLQEFQSCVYEQFA